MYKLDIEAGAASQVNGTEPASQANGGTAASQRNMTPTASQRDLSSAASLASGWQRYQGDVAPLALPGPSASSQPTPCKARPALTSQPGLAHVKRNLAESLDSPAPKRMAGEQTATHLVADITPYTNKYTLKVHMQTISRPRTINTRNFSGS